MVTCPLYDSVVSEQTNTGDTITPPPNDSEQQQQFMSEEAVRVVTAKLSCQKKKRYGSILNNNLFNGKFKIQ